MLNGGTTSLLLLVGIAIVSWTVFELKSIQNQLTDPLQYCLQLALQIQSTKVPQELQQQSVQQLPIAWIDGPGENLEATYMKHIFEVFRLLGYHVITGPQPLNVQWDVMWTHEFPFSNDLYRHQIHGASPDQLINHVPGSGFYTSKVALATANISIGVPQAFQLPYEKEKFIEFAKENPDYLWVQKDNNHRNIEIKLLTEIDFEKPESFVQRFVDNPLLIDNRKFDIGIYTVITSLRPLKVYILDEGLLRFCPEDYHPFDQKKVDKYVVGDDYTPIWEMFSLKSYYIGERLNFKNSLNAYLKAQGKSPEMIWNQIRKIIAEVFYQQQEKMLTVFESTTLGPRFFELSRFDFIVDDELNVYLMEANMSPNLSSGHFKENQILYEQVLMNIFSLIGVEKHIKKNEMNYLKSRGGLWNSFISDRDLSISIPECATEICSDCQNQEKCDLCTHCWSNDFLEILREITREHQFRRNMKTKEDELLQKWLMKKCEERIDWCPL
ncbi:unnamed protein product, partial [Mesorhabditis belari]|uniref:Uncharacterized protein n=1 Tax=Mesorhabditis belari TaxID=2138241 RepID=A0AAF3E920_9BILA